VQQEKALQVRGKWPRWSRYEIVNAAVVPTRDAQFTEYDPWSAYYLNADRYRTVEQPYNSFLELGSQLQDEQARGVRPSKVDSRRSATKAMLGPQNGADRLILDWCNDNGLLGLVPVLSTLIRLRNDTFHYRDGGKWFTRFEEQDAPRRSTTTTRPQVQSGEEDSITWPVDGRGVEEKLTWLSDDSLYEHEWTSLSDKRAFFDTWKRGRMFAPFRPGSRAFWNVYAEPVEEIARWSVLFTKAAKWLSRPSSGGGGDNGFLIRSYLIIKKLTESAAPSFQLHPARKIVLDEERIPAGLLASYALMFAWDLMEGRRAIQCEVCQRYFVSDEYRAAYCSRRCRNTAQTRRHRAKKMKS